jgi:hypothetical protein
MISYMISYYIKDLTVPSPEAVAFQIERVASCLGPSTVELTLPLNATECLKLPFAVAGIRAWEPGYSPGWRSAPMQSTPRPAWGGLAAPAQNSHQSMRQAL